MFGCIFFWANKRFYAVPQRCQRNENHHTDNKVIHIALRTNAVRNTAQEFGLLRLARRTSSKWCGCKEQK